jgi:hypothetical protein
MPQNLFVNFFVQGETKSLCTYRRRCVCSESPCTLMQLHFSYLSYNKWEKWPPHAGRRASTRPVCKYTQRFNRRNIPEELRSLPSVQGVCEV